MSGSVSAGALPALKASVIDDRGQSGESVFMLRDNILRLFVFALGFSAAQLAQDHLHEQLRAPVAPSVDIVLTDLR